MIPFIYQYRKGKTTGAQRPMTVGPRAGVVGENFWGEGNILYLDCDGT